MSDVKMSEVFDLPLNSDFDVINDDNYNELACFSSAGEDDAAVHAINSHDAMAERIKVLEAALGQVLEISGESGEQNMANFDEELASQHNDDIVEIYRIVKALKEKG